MIKPISNDFNLFKNFYYVAMTGSFSKAAKELFISQPTVSYNVKCLEKNLNTQLFIRKSKGIELTDEGKTIIEYIETAYNSILLAERSITNSQLLNKGTLNIGGPSYIINKFISPLICEFTKRYPLLKVNIITKSSSELLKLLKTNRIDILIDTLPIDELTDNIKVETLWKKETCFAGTKENVKKYDPANDRILLFPEVRSDIGKYLLQEFLLKNWNPNIKMQITSTEIMLELAKSGVGIGYFMEDYIEKELESGELKKIKTNIKMPTINITCFYINEFLNYAAKQFLLDLRQFVSMWYRCGL